MFDIPEVVVRPTPVQRPGIPVWIGGTSDPALRRAIRRRSPVFPGATDGIDVVRRRVARAAELAEQLALRAPDELVVPRLALVADTVEEARRRALPGIRAMFETYQSWGIGVDFGAILRDWRALDEFVIVGDEAYCSEQVARYAELRVTDLMLQFALPTVEPAVAAEAQARFPRARVPAAGGVTRTRSTAGRPIRR